MHPMNAEAAAATASAAPRRLARATRWARRHWLAVAAIILIAAAVTGPRWYLLWSDPPAGVRVQVAPWAAQDMGYDLALFAPAIRDAYDGDVSPARMFSIAPDVSTPPGGIWLQVIGRLGRITGSPFSALAIVVTLSMLVAMALLYALALEATGDRVIAAAVVPLAALFDGVVVQAGILRLRDADVLRAVITANDGREFHAWFRFLPPAMPMPVFFACALAIPRAVETGRRGWMIAASLVLALLIYTYLFYWLAMAVALALWCAWLLVRREHTMLMRLLLIGAAAVALASPELLARVRDALTLSAEAQARFGKEAFGLNRGEVVNGVQRLVLSIPFVVALWRSGERARFFALLLVVPAVLDLVDGVVPQTEHYVTQVWHVFALPGLIAGTAILARPLPGLVRAYGRYAVVGAALVAVAWVVAFQVRTTRTVQAQFAIPVDERAAFDWMEENLSGTDTVVSPSVNSNMLIPALTPAGRYMVDGFFTRLSDDEIIDRFLRAQAAFGISEEDVFRRLDPSNSWPTSGPVPPAGELQQRFELSSAYFLYNWQIIHPDRLAARLAEWRARYRALSGAADVLRPYDADYLFCGPRERQFAVGAAPVGEYVTVAFQQDGSTVYRLVDASAPGAAAFQGC